MRILGLSCWKLSKQQLAARWLLTQHGIVGWVVQLVIFGWFWVRCIASGSYGILLYA